MILNRATYLAAFAIAALGGTATSAADLIVEQPVVPGIVETSSSWEGFYVGASIGGVWADAGYDGPPIDTSAEFFDYEASGFAASLYAGYNWQVSDAFVLGVEGEISWLGLEFDADRLTVGVIGPWEYLSADWSGALSVRGGVLVTPDVLLYGKLGYSWTDWQVGPYGGDPVIDDGVIGAVQVGVGAEMKVTDKVTLRGELAYNFSGDDVSAAYGDIVYAYTPSFGTAKVGLSFKF